VEGRDQEANEGGDGSAEGEEENSIGLEVPEEAGEQVEEANAQKEEKGEGWTWVSEVKQYERVF